MTKEQAKEIIKQCSSIGKENAPGAIEARKFLEGREAGIREAALICRTHFDYQMTGGSDDFKLAGVCTYLRKRILDLLKDKQ